MHKTDESEVSVPLATNGEVSFTLKELRHVSLLVETNNFVRAADRAGISQSALSQSIAGLEARIGLLLFNRNRRNVQPTVIAQILAERGRLILNTLSDISTQVEAMRDARDGTVQFGFGVAPAAWLMAESMQQFSAHYPAVKVHVEVAYNHELIEMLRQGALEFCVSIPETKLEYPDLVIEPLYNEPMGFLCRADHPLTRLRNPHIADVVEFPIIGNSESHARQLLGAPLQEPRKAGLQEKNGDMRNTRLVNGMVRSAKRKSEPGVAFEQKVLAISLQRIELLAPLIASTDYVAIGVISLFREWLSDGRLVHLQVADHLPALCTSIVTRRGIELTPAAKRMTGIIRQIALEVREADVAFTLRGRQAADVGAGSIRVNSSFPSQEGKP